MKFLHNAYRWNNSPLWAFCVLSLLGFGLYGQTLHYDFHFDDSVYIINNPYIRDVSNIPMIWNFMPIPVRFIGILSFAINYHFTLDQPWSYRLVNILIHVLNGFLVWAMIRLLPQTPRFKGTKETIGWDHLAWVAAILFVVHPLQIQAVTFITQRLASLAALFYLLCVYAFLRGRLARPTARMTAWLAVSVMSCVLGMFTKEITITIPFMIVFFEIALVRCLSWRALWRDRSFWLILVLVMMLLMVIPLTYSWPKVWQSLMASNASSSHAGDTINLFHYFVAQWRVIWVYFKLVVLPIGQNLDYDFAMQPWYTVKSLLGLFGLLTIGAVAWTARHRQPILCGALIWMGITMFIESSVFPIAHVIFEHRMYLPMVGCCLFLAYILTVSFRSRRIRLAAVSVVVMTLMYANVMRNQVWADGVRLWADNVKKSPQKFRPYMNLGSAYLKKGEYELALKAFDDALRFKKRDAELFLNRGVVYKELGYPEKAMADFSAAMKLGAHDFAEPYNNRALVLMASGKDSEALVDLNEAIRKRPSHAESFVNRGLLYEKKGQFEAAFNDYTMAIRIDPTLEEAYNNRASLLRKNGQPEAALRDYNQAININSKVAQFYTNRALLLKQIRQYERALADVNQAIDLQPDIAAAYNVKGLIYNDLKRWSDALEWFDKAIALEPKLAEFWNNRGLAYKHLKRLEEALADYEQCLKIDDQYVYAYVNRATLYQSQRQTQQALADFSRALALNPKQAEIYNNRGVLYKDLGEFDKAIADYTQAISLKPNYPMAYNNRGIVYHRQRQHQKALEDFAQALSLQPGHPYSLFNRSNVHIAQKNFDLAMADLSELISREPNWGIAYFRRSNIYDYQKNFQASLEDALTAQAKGYEVSSGYLNRLKAQVRLLP